MSTITVSITYSVTTVEQGEYTDHGFYGHGGRKYSIADEHFQILCDLKGRDQAIKDMTPSSEVFKSVEGAVNFIQRDGPFDAFGSTFTQSSPSGDRAYFEEGEDTRLSYHVVCSHEILKKITQALAS
jgi:hypothetical protein